MKRIHLIILCAILALCGGSLSVLHAQVVGEWKVYPSYMNATRNLTVGTMVYSLCDGNLLRYDTEDGSVKTYDSLTDLNGVHISQIAYCEAAKRLVLVYDDQNIDLMDLDDNLFNITALKDKTLTNKEVSSICIRGTRAYLATGFGFIELDVREGVIIDTYQLDKTVTSILVDDDYYYLCSTKGVFAAKNDASTNLHVLDSWSQVSYGTSFLDAVAFQGNIICRKTNRLFPLLDNKSLQPMLKSTHGDLIFLTTLSDGTMACADTSYLYLYSSLDTYKRVPITKTTNWVSLLKKNYWISEGLQGLRGYVLNDTTLTETVGAIQPNSPQRDLFNRMSYVSDSNGGYKLLVAGGRVNYSSVNNMGTVMSYDGQTWTNFDESYWTKFPDIRHYNFSDIVQDPLDATHHYVGSFRTGMYEFKDTKFEHLYNSSNSPIQSIYPGKSSELNYCALINVAYDANGTLWMANDQVDTVICYMTPNKKWNKLYFAEIDSIPTTSGYLFTTSGMNFLISQRLEKRGFFGFSTDGKQHKLIQTIVNEDKTSYSPNNFYCMTEDLDGKVWCGTDFGLFVMDDPTKFFNSDFTFNQIKISRNDGSGLADYLLNGVCITCIAVDGANRKWVGTSGNGIYLISADGQTLVQHFTTDDSSILSDDIESIAVHPKTGVVMIGTDLGLCSYNGDATTAEEELSKDNVIAYPNPVRPDYTGMIRIEGLTYNAEVKICSVTGQLIASGISNGGTFTWNGCNKQGRRVSSGVYHVIASTEEGNMAVVCRVIVIK